MMQHLRLYHAILAISAILAYLSGEMGLVHAWLGYGVAAIIVFRLGWALIGARELGLKRFYPVFTGLKLDNVFTHPAVSRTLLLGIALLLIGVTATGIAMDRGYALGQGTSDRSSSAVSIGDVKTAAVGDADKSGENETWLGELHDALANLLLIFVVTHIVYLVSFKRPLAKFIFYLETPTQRAKSDEPK
jgi:cytochrome b